MKSRSDSTYLILCGGKGRRWGDHLGVPKHLIPIDGIPLLIRTIRLVCSIDSSAKIIVVGESHELSMTEDVDVRFCRPSQISMVETEADKFLLSSNKWNTQGRTVILLGDVWYTRNSLLKIAFYRKRKWMVFGRQKRSLYTGCDHGELFAWSFWPEHIQQFAGELLSLREFYSRTNTRVASGWGHYNLRFQLEFLMTGEKVNKGFALMSTFFHLDDFTEDFDYPTDFDNWRESRKRWNDSGSIFKISLMVKQKIYLLFTKAFNICFEYAIAPTIRLCNRLKQPDGIR